MATKSTTGPDSIAGMRSQAGWSDPGTAALDDDALPSHPFAAPAGSRYQDREVVGTGGMGVVSVALDRRLGREVALKRIAVELDDPAAAARLAREASITARLEHPGIVAVYDAGLGDDGRLYYTMRLIRGRSLADALRGARDREARLALIRHFLDACHAVGYAHRHGVVHRDLKPANIMVGEFAETQVVDWGLARLTDEPTETVASTGSAHELSAAITVAGLVGTPAYLSPERARFQVGDRSGDVWALGAILVELITGARMMADDSAEAIIARLRSDAPLIREWSAGAPAALCAIADRALAWSATDRYRDASELAADLERYLDGRRVHAHVYSPLELLRRLLHAWRWPLRIVGAAVVAAVIVLALTWRRMDREHDRAMAAEATAQDALTKTEDALAWALDTTAVATLAAGHSAEAETIAAHALRTRESPEARGVLAATRAAAHPVDGERRELPGCARVIPQDTATALCVSPNSVTSWALDPVRERWNRVIAADEVIAVGNLVVLSEPGVALVVLDARDGRELTRISELPRIDMLIPSRDIGGALATDGRELVAIGSDALPRRLGRVCDHDPIAAVANRASRIAVVCGTGSVRSVEPTGKVSHIADVALGNRLRPATAAALDATGERLAVGGVGGEVTIVSLRTRAALPPQAILAQPVNRLAFASTGILVGGEQGVIAWRSDDLTAELARFPAAARGELVIDGDLLIAGGTSWWSWRLPARPTTRWFVTPAGLSGAGRSSDGERIAASRGDGKVTVWRVIGGTTVAELALADAVIKGVDFSPDGTRLMASISQPFVGTALIDTATWQPVDHEASHRGTLRVGHFAGGERIAIHYGEGWFRWPTDGPRVEDAGPVIVDAAMAARRTSMWLLDREGAVWKLVANGAATATEIREPGARAVVGTDDGSLIVTVHPSEVVVHSAGSKHHFVTESGAALHACAIDPQGTWLAVGDAAGTITVWRTRDRRVVAILRGHTQRVSWLELAGDTLWSAGWDGQLRRWDLGALDRDPELLLRDARSAWTLDLEIALGHHRGSSLR
ncbi:MAG: WD40 repeat domain-containing serine/threonine protein kinase [Kofleriaceae bacterium]